MLDFLSSIGIKVEKGSEVYRKLALELLKAEAKAIQMLKARHQGDPVDTPKAAPVVFRTGVVDPQSDTLEALSDYWQKKASRGRTSVAEASNIIKRFREHVGDIPASRVERKHIIALEDAMIAEGLAPSTVNKSLGILGAIFQNAVYNMKLEMNPCHGRKKLKTDESGGGRAYTTQELQTIFSSSVFTAKQRPKSGRGEAAFWIPLIGLYTGARVAEVSQLFVGDIREEQGIHYFNFTVDDETDRRVKNKGSIRRVPIHPDLIHMGLLQYHEETAKEGHQQLFPLLTVPRSGGKLSDKWRVWWSGYVRELGITEVPQPFHAFRHTFIAAARACEIPSDSYHRFTGHSSGNVGDSYGGQFPIRPLFNAMKQVKYEGLELSHLWKE